jgi:hypothetical protein
MARYRLSRKGFLKGKLKVDGEVSKIRTNRRITRFIEGSSNRGPTGLENWGL